MSPRLGKIAADLLEVDGVRMYHDQALFKEAGGGFTPWHVDQHYWPMATDRSVTAWIPLQATPLDMGPMQFAAGSQRLDTGRHLHISDDSEREIGEHLKLADFQMVCEPYDLGEVSFHLGWTFHRAGANVTDRPRNVMTIIYMDEKMTLAEPKNKSQENDRAGFMPGIEVGELCDTPKNPVIFSYRKK
jgi:ectoine hydroxylase-related dioxygenase (phytanoyl-CoA dioxygenase family)